MSWTGILTIIPGAASRLQNPQPTTVPNGVRLAIEGAPQPFIDATDALINNHFITGNHVRISGRSEPAGAPTLIFMTNVERLAGVAGPLVAAAVHGAAKKGGAKKGGAKKAGGAKKGGAKKAAKKGSSTKSTGASAKSGKKAPAKSAAKKSAAKKSTKRSARKGGKKQR